MNTRLTHYALATSTLLLFGILSAQASAQEPEDKGIRYEDDAWYDVSEWFDGNDYNPTDEAIGRWDDEKFDYFDDLTSSDRDNDGAIDAEEFYGTEYSDGYGRFVDSDADGFYETYKRYHDTDNDYLNDSYAIYHDADGDGMYETYEFSELSNSTEHAIHPNNVAQSTRKGLSGKRVRVSGKITDTKLVDRLGGMAWMLKVTQRDGSSIWVDMGNDFAYQLFQGDSLTAFGPIVKAGNKETLMATSIEAQGKLVDVDRPGRRYSGTLTSTRTATVRGDKRTVAKLETENGKMLTVDLGAPERTRKFKQGDQLTVTGVPVKIGDRVILIADVTQL